MRGGSNFQDLSGRDFGRWHVMYRGPDKSYNSGTSKIAWHCKCKCGNEKDVLGGSLVSGRSLSCGCLCNEQTRIRVWKGYEDISGNYLRKIREGAKKRIYT